MSLRETAIAAEVSELRRLYERTRVTLALALRTGADTSEIREELSQQQSEMGRLSGQAESVAQDRRLRADS
jgi:hypothetical protein